MSVDRLRELPLFAGLPDADLARLHAQAEPVTISPGALLVEEGASGDALFVLLDGRLQVSKRAGVHDVSLDVRLPGAVIGEMSLVDNAPRSATVRALTECHLLRVSRDAFEHTLSTSPAAARAILHTVVARLRQNEALLHEREKMAGIGTLAAGMAHELNNPAAGVRRAASQLRASLDSWRDAMRDVDGLDLTDAQRAQVAELHADSARRARKPADLDPLTRSDREGDVEEWLESHGVAEASDLAPTLVNFGWQVAELERLAKQFDAASLSAIARALGTGTAVQVLLAQVGSGAERISEIVTAVKSYAYLDRAPVQEVDVHEGLESTLAMLSHRLEKTSICITRDCAPDLPRIEAWAGELNQVWTNIINNAIDALGHAGEITIRTHRDGDVVVVEIRDSGPGIAPDVQSRVFEPFFTTKPPGAGVGLGLNIAYNVVHKHHGEIRLTSAPGDTCFQVRLPTTLPRT